MRKSSTATVRARPVATSTAVSGALQLHAQTLTVETTKRTELIDLTDRLMDVVHAHHMTEGLVNVCSLHTTCTVLINESQPALLADMQKFLEHVVSDDANWMHNDPAHSDCDRQNADSHLRAMLLGHSLSLQVSGGEIVLGQWQRILLAELDGPRTRNIRVMLMGVA